MKPGSNPDRPRRCLTPYLVLAAAMIISLLATYTHKLMPKPKTGCGFRVSFNRPATQQRDTIENRLDTYIALLRRQGLLFLPRATM